MTDGLITEEAKVALIGLLNGSQDVRVFVPVAATKLPSLQMVPDTMGCEFVMDPLKSQFSQNVYKVCSIPIYER